MQRQEPKNKGGKRKGLRADGESNEEKGNWLLCNSDRQKLTWQERYVYICHIGLQAGPTVIPKLKRKAKEIKGIT